MLGIHGAFNEFELAMIMDRMVESMRQKAARGELRQPVPPGYIYRHNAVCEKHPDVRVQRAVEEVFQEFSRSVSVYALYRQLSLRGFQIPIVPPREDWREIKWVQPTYTQLLGMLKNPAYAGIYVRGQSKTVTDLDQHGHAIKRNENVPREEWPVFIEQHHESYIDKETWEENVKKIASNARCTGPPRTSPGSGVALLAGLLRCRRCGNKLQVHYSSGSHVGVRYLCRRGVRQRAVPPGNCFGFAGESVDRRVSELILQVVRPAGIEAARLAVAEMAAVHQQQRQLLVDRLEACREAESRAARQYKSTDESYTTVRGRLAQDWDKCLQTVAMEERRLAEFDAQQPTPLTTAQWEQLQRLSDNLEQVWFDPKTDSTLKKQIARTLIEEIVVNVEDHEIVLSIHWSGGHHTQTRMASPNRKRQAHADDVKVMLETLRKVLSDQSIANLLNRRGIPTWTGTTWTKRRVEYLRKRHNISGFNLRQKAPNGWLTQSETATRLSISPRSVSRLVQANVLPAERPGEGFPCVILEQDLATPTVRKAVQQIKAAKQGPLPPDSNQLNLFPTTPEE